MGNSPNVTDNLFNTEPTNYGGMRLGYVMDRSLDAARMIADRDMSDHPIANSVKQRFLATSLLDAYIVWRTAMLGVSYDNSESSLIDSFLSNIFDGDRVPNRAFEIGNLLSSDDFRKAATAPLELFIYFMRFYAAGDVNDSVMDNVESLFQNKLETGTIFGRMHRDFKLPQEEVKFDENTIMRSNFSLNEDPMTTLQDFIYSFEGIGNFEKETVQDTNRVFYSVNDARQSLSL